MPSTAPEESTQVAVGIVVDPEGRLLISQRGGGRHLAGKWEFPGGKVEIGEPPQIALARELLEEVGLVVIEPEPLTRVTHHYPAHGTHSAKTVTLHCFRIQQFRGEARSRIGQPLRWVEPEQLPDYPMPAGNRGLISALKLPHHYPISAACQQRSSFLGELTRLFQGGCPLYCLRQPQLPEQRYRELAISVIELGARLGTQVILRADPDLVVELGAAGVQLSSRQLMALTARPLPSELLVGASCHTPQELTQAHNISADYALVSPVNPTPSHPAAKPLGWSGFSELLKGAALPVYALGGMRLDDLEQARARGALGIAGISCFR